MIQRSKSNQSLKANYVDYHCYGDRDRGDFYDCDSAQGGGEEKKVDEKSDEEEGRGRPGKNKTETN